MSGQRLQYWSGYLRLEHQHYQILTADRICRVGAGVNAQRRQAFECFRTDVGRGYLTRRKLANQTFNQRAPHVAGAHKSQFALFDHQFLDPIKYDKSQAQN